MFNKTFCSTIKRHNIVAERIHLSYSNEKVKWYKADAVTYSSGMENTHRTMQSKMATQSSSSSAPGIYNRTDRDVQKTRGKKLTAEPPCPPFIIGTLMESHRSYEERIGKTCWSGRLK